MTKVRDTVGECLPHKNVLERPDYTEFEVQALRALARGKASERQQLAALEYMARAFGTYDASYRPDDPHGTVRGRPRRFVEPVDLRVKFDPQEPCRRTEIAA